MFQFAHPIFLYLLAVIPIILIFHSISAKRRKKLLADFGDTEIIRELMPEKSRTRPFFKLVLLLFAWAFFVFGIAGPQIGSKLRENKQKGIELIIALDVSNSMLAQDIQPSRLERAKQAISTLVGKMENDRLGLIVFAGQAFTQLPITNDYISAKMFLSNISTNSVPVPGTAIGAAINLASKSFSPNLKGDRAIIVITDGENHEDDAVEAAKAAREKGIFVHTIGVGLPQGAPVPVEAGSQNYIKDASGVVISKLDEDMLQKIAAAGDGNYVRATNTQLGLNSIFESIKKMNQSEYSAKNYSDYEDQYQWPMAVAFLFLLIEAVIMERRTKWSRRLKLFQVKK
ncbi:MAG: VWA domain-containing protein [Bacteroidota bacterium]|nr:VWA domain-containing protein [Bacteroidota bacterium]